MMNESNELKSIADILERLVDQDQALACDIKIVEETLPELRRLAKAAPYRSGGPGSRDAKKYALGSTLWMYGFAGIDPQELTGLLAHPVLMVRWLGEHVLRCPNAPLGMLIDDVLSDPERSAFCKQWGRVIEWRYRKALYDDEAASFETSGKTGLSASWRKHKPSTKQEALIATLCEILEINDPDLKTKGAAYEWIREHGGNPSYWHEPMLPEDWKGM